MSYRSQSCTTSHNLPTIVTRFLSILIAILMSRLGSEHRRRGRSRYYSRQSSTRGDRGSLRSPRRDAQQLPRRATQSIAVEAHICGSVIRRGTVSNRVRTINEISSGQRRPSALQACLSTPSDGASPAPSISDTVSSPSTLEPCKEAEHEPPKQWAGRGWILDHRQPADNNNNNLQSPAHHQPSHFNGHVLVSETGTPLARIEKFRIGGTVEKTATVDKPLSRATTGLAPDEKTFAQYERANPERTSDFHQSAGSVAPSSSYFTSESPSRSSSRASESSVVHHQVIARRQYSRDLINQHPSFDAEMLPAPLSIFHRRESKTRTKRTTSMSPNLGSKQIFNESAREERTMQCSTVRKSSAKPLSRPRSRKGHNEQAAEEHNPVKSTSKTPSSLPKPKVSATIPSACVKGRQEAPAERRGSITAPVQPTPASQATRGKGADVQCASESETVAKKHSCKLVLGESCKAEKVVHFKGGLTVEGCHQM